MTHASMGIHSISNLSNPQASNASALCVCKLSATLFHLKSHKERGMTMRVKSSSTMAATYSAITLSVNHPGCTRPVSHTTTMAKAIDNAPHRMHSNNVRVFLIITNLNDYCPKGVRLMMERPSVTSSVYSNSSPTEIPLARTVSRTSYPLSFLEI